MWTVLYMHFISGRFVCTVCVYRVGSDWGRVRGYWSPAAAQTRAYYCYPTECHLSHTLLASCLHTPDLSLHKPIVNACHTEAQKPSLGRLTRLIKNDTELKLSAAFRLKILRCDQEGKCSPPVNTHLICLKLRHGAAGERWGWAKLEWTV